MHVTAPYQTWGSPEAPTTLFFQDESGFLIRFPGVAEFLITHAGEVQCRPSPGAEGWRAILEQQVQPLLLSLRGEQVFHGGAVAAGDQAVAFLAPSGQGKSTLTAAFARRGMPFLSDDCLHLELGGPQAYVRPHVPYLRLWEDSAEVLGDGEAAYVAGSPKPRLMAGDGLPYHATELPLARIYLLGPGDAESPVIEPVSASQALMGLTANAFVLDIKNPEVLRRNLQAHARLVREIAIRRLDYPRRYDVLDSVVDAVLADLAG